MTTERLRELLTLADENYHIIREHVPEETEVVFVSSRDVSSAIIGDDDLRFRRTDEQMQDEGYIAEYNGVDVYCINEDEASEIFAPAVFCRDEFVDYMGLRPEDFVIYRDNQDDRLYRLARRDPTTMYSDTGFTVNALGADFVQIDMEAVNTGLETLNNTVIDRIDNITFRNNDGIRIVYEGMNLAEDEPLIHIDTDGVRPLRIRWDEPMTTEQLTMNTTDTAAFTAINAQFNAEMLERLIHDVAGSSPYQRGRLYFKICSRRKNSSFFNRKISDVF